MADTRHELRGEQQQLRHQAAAVVHFTLGEALGRCTSQVYQRVQGHRRRFYR